MKKDILTKQEASQIAYHEIAHIIVKEHFGGEIDTLTVDGGGIKVKFRSSNNIPKCSMYQDICVAMAGVVAEKVYTNSIIDFENQSDILFVEGLLENIGIFMEEIMEEAVSEIKNILDHNKDKLENLVDQLSEIIIDWDTNRYNGESMIMFLNYNNKEHTITKKG